ncbi:GNAT family N-acetyltransferase [uncultured Chitinophaga sp.]|uniref:GNAT family N-acetyltransferase n=1 Tax=uncultured Chitinophaga sp. TaxID=339340 RepID=UPI0025DD4648|nr:GNAT family N-acetyltransferase [uncultured Chitinophaga sp.]
MIETSRLQLLPCTLHHFEALFQGEEVLADLLDISVPENWTEYPEMVLLAYDKLRNDPSMLGWFFYLVIHKEDRRLIGTGGFKGKACENGVVEIGYEIAGEYREKGYATEMVMALIGFAFSHSYINTVRAHTLEEYNAAVKVLQKAGMHFAGAITDQEEDELWRWEINRADYQEA